jgi:serine phosphatase RsbU (regulator of sigma subunit)
MSDRYTYTTQLNKWLRRPGPAVVVTGLLLLVIEVADYLTSRHLDLSVAFVLPIAYVVWALGRRAGLITACLAEAETAVYFASLIRSDALAAPDAAISLIIRLLLFVMTAEIVFRLVKAVADARNAASQLAVVNSELKALYARQDEDLATAGAVQREVIAPVPPTVPGLDIGATVRYASTTGGDFADTGIVDGRVFLCVADVSGKGTTASLFTVLLKHLLDDGHKRGLRGGSVIEALYRGLRQRLTSDKFVTVFYAEIDPANGAVEYVNAGHTEGLILRAETREMETTEMTAPILTSSITILDFHVSTLNLRPGDTMVIYSDGATDSRTHSGKRLGEAPVRRLAMEQSHLGAQEMADSICNRIEAETDPDGRDDLAVVCVRRGVSLHQPQNASRVSEVVR